MHLKIEGAHVMFKAIESFHFDEVEAQTVVRTVSGQTYRQKTDSAERHEKFVALIVEQMAICEAA